MKSPEQEYLQPLWEGARQRSGEAYQKANHSTEEKDKAYRENPTSEEAADYERFSRVASKAWDAAVAAEDEERTLGRKMEEASMKAWMIQYQADQTGQAVAKHVRTQLRWIKVMLLVLVLVVAYATLHLPSWVSQ